VTIRSAFRWGSRLLFISVFLVAVALSFAADAIAVALLASVLLAQMLYVVLPMNTVREKAEEFYSGEAGEQAYEELEDRGGNLR